MSLLYLKQLVINAWLPIIHHKRRSFLTMLGIIIGVSSVIIIMAIGAGAQSLILNQVKTFGGNLVIVLPGQSEQNAPPATVFGINIVTLTNDDAQALKNKRNVPNLQSLVAYSRGVGTVNWQANSYDTNLSGVSADYQAVEGGLLANGRFFTEDESTGLAKVVVLGSEVKDQLFHESEAVGQRIRLKNMYFEVIGVMAARGSAGFQNYDDNVFLPLGTMQKLVNGTNYLGMIRLKVDEDQNVKTAINDIVLTLRERHNITDPSGNSDDFSVRDAASALSTLTTITNALKYFLAAMAALSLLVGGIGIMNIMLIRVAERTREIGLRKAVGANNLDILYQFLFESATLTLIGGVIGIIAGEAVSYLIAVIARFMGYDWAFTVSPLSIILATAVSIAIGVIFGLLPAKRAGKLEPVEALRYE